MMQEAKRKRRSVTKPAYTLTEMLVVLVIVGLLAAIVGPHLFRQLDTAKVRTARLQMTNVESALELFRLDVGRFPSDEEGLSALVAAPAGVEDGWMGPYLARSIIPRDPWGHEYSYQRDANGNVYELTSFGADGREGGSAANADIIVKGGSENSVSNTNYAPSVSADTTENAALAH